MTQYEKTMIQKDLCLSASMRTKGEMKAIWEAKAFYLLNKLDNMSLEEAREEVNGQDL